MPETVGGRPHMVDDEKLLNCYLELHLRTFILLPDELDAPSPKAYTNLNFIDTDTDQSR